MSTACSRITAGLAIPLHKRKDMTRSLSIALLLGVAASGCEYTASIHPLYVDGEAAVSDARIEGSWVTPDLDKLNTYSQPKATWTIAPRTGSAGEYLVEARSTDPYTRNEVNTFRVRLIADAGRLFFDAEFESYRDDGAGLHEPEPPILVAGHVIGRAWIEPDFVRLAMPSAEWFKSHAPPGTWIFHDEKFGSSLVITTPTDELRRMLRTHADDEDVFGQMVFLCRPGKECLLHIADAYAERWSNDEALDAAGDLYSLRRRHDRAIRVRQRLTELDPKDPWRQIELGREYLDAGRFEEARGAVRAAGQLAAQDAATAEEVYRVTAWSFFLDGRYADTVRLVRAHTPAKSNASAEPILLASAALSRLGEREQADVLLRAETERFTGSAEEHALLLHSLGRLTDWSWTDDRSREQHRHMQFFDGLQQLAAGNVQAARDTFTAVASDASGLYVLAARLELQRLDAKR